MPQNTGIKNREKFINKVLSEDKSAIGKDTAYGRYLASLKELVRQTNGIFEKDGYMDKDSYENLVNQYMAVVKNSIAFRDSKESQTRRDVVEHIHKLISNDLKALNRMDKENPGNIRTAFEESRYVTVKVPQDMTHKVGGQASDRFPMIDADGKKGFFTARVDTAHDKDWNALIDTIFSTYNLSEEEKAPFNRLRTDHEFRSKIVEPVYTQYSSGEPDIANVAVTLTLFKDSDEAVANMEKNNALADAVFHFTENCIKLLTPYNLKDRLGYDPYTRTDNKNVAMYEVAKLMGCENLVAKAVPMKVVNGDRVIKGTFMENAEGSDLATMDYDDPIVKINPSTSMYNKSLYKDLADLQMLDYICGNVDRHDQNMIYKTEKAADGSVNVTGVIAIDNDASFPERDIKEGEFASFPGNRPNIFKPENFHFVNKKTAELVLNLSREQLETVLRGQNIKPLAIEKAWNRLQHVQTVLKGMRKNNITFVENIEEKTYINPADADNPFRNINDDYVTPSIFTGFNTNLYQQVQDQKTAIEQDHIAREGRFNLQEQLALQKAQREENEAKTAKAEQLNKDTLLFANFDTIEKMNILMKRINVLKSPSNEFAKMSSAMFSLHEYAQQLAKQVKDENKSLTKEEYAEYEKRMVAMRDATENYIQKKGISQKTKIGRERHDAALRLFNRADMLFANFEILKEQEEKLRYRPLKSIRNEAKMYADIKSAFKGYNGKELKIADLKDEALKRAIDHLLERKEILDKLSDKSLSAEDEKVWQGKLKDSDDYFAGMNEDTRNLISDAFSAADPDVARTKEWQALHMAFIATATIDSYKAVETMNATMENYKNLKTAIDMAKADINRQMEEAKKDYNGVLTVQNADAEYQSKENSIAELKKKMEVAKAGKAEAEEKLKEKENLTAEYNKYISSATEAFNKETAEIKAEVEKLEQLKAKIEVAKDKTDASEKVILYGQIFPDAAEKDEVKADSTNIDDKLKSKLDDITNEINSKADSIKDKKNAFDSNVKKKTEVYNNTVTDLERLPRMYENRIKQYTGQIERFEKAKAIINKFKNPADNFDISGLKAAMENGKQAPKLDVNAVLKSTQLTAGSLKKMTEMYSEGHTNSKEFDTMVKDLDVVISWGENNQALNGMTNPPKTVEQALANLKNSSKKYLEEKGKQWRPNPSQRRYMRNQLAETLGVFAEQSLECLDAVGISEKVAESWHKYFESGGKSRILEESKNNLNRNENQLDDPEKDENDIGFDI